MATIFPGFPHLPPELRNKVWRAALPTNVGRPLYTYRGRGCWRARRLDESDPHFLKDDGEMAMDFRTDLLGGDPTFHVPLVCVNREARGIALSWLDEQSIKPEQTHPGSCIFRRLFDRTQDTLYIPDDKWDDFNLEPHDRLGEPDLVNQNVNVNGEVDRIAISSMLFWKQDTVRWLHDLHSWYDITVVSVVIGSQPDPGQESCRERLNDTDGRALVWHRTSHTFKVAQATDYTVDEKLHTEMEVFAREHLTEQQGFRNLPTLEIRPVTLTPAQ
ncbi:hypothetical protein LEL_10818 [Akanthomyces lecanii RCEF 1005]|uniref:2EXR domain-containing protein n=1 Tax=Akanthomyces lecanii RCEF 1005 TaxID=1081108 RepID=A0A167T345_CORDF|nr:hypothetical protein LEL_10818 [Akanthomyces lecanii RCEF 1005]